VALKFIIVVGWFMHVRFENPLLNRFFTGGFVLAFSLYLVVLAAMGVVVIRGGLTHRPWPSSSRSAPW
jgi:hypothetical protein